MSRNCFQTSQNCDNFMGDRPSTRTHKPPGGGSQLSYLFGGEDSNPPQNQDNQRVRSGKKQSFQQGSNPIYDNTNAPQQQQMKAMPNSRQQYQQQPQQQQQQPQDYGNNPAQDYSFGARPKMSSNTFANGANQNSGNFITDRSTTRLHAPPGGKSSITFG